MASLRQKLTFGYGMLIAVLVVVSAWSIYHFVRLGRAVDVILVRNYKSIIAAENMKEALERQDSAAMFFVAGHRDPARRQFQEYSAKFQAEYAIAAGNITEEGEEEVIADIEAKYLAYRQRMSSFLDNSTAAGDMNPSAVYFGDLGPAFLALKDRLDNLLHLNQEAMLRANDRALAISKRGEISTAAIAVLAPLLALIFAWRFTRYVVSPIGALTEQAKRIGEGDLDQYIETSSKDEIGLLAREFNRMTARLRDLRKSDYGRLLLEQLKSDAVIDSLYDPVIVTDARGHITKINRAARALFGGSTGNGDAGPAELFLGTFEGGDRILRAIRDAVAIQPPIGPAGEAAAVPIKVGGAERNFTLRATPVRDPDGRLLGAVTLLEDVTALKEVDRVKTDFISMASSRLRDPLRTVQLALHALIDGQTGELNERQLDLLIAARDDTETLDQMMTDLLGLAEIESGASRLTPERLRPIELAREAVAKYEFEAQGKRIKLVNNVWPDLSWVLADRKAVGRIFDNLLSNALRHTGRDDRIVIDAREGVGHIIFSVSDTGEGITKELLPNLFGRFLQAAEKEGRAGLGLALVKQLVEAQGGQVGVESRLGEGSTFTFSLPIGGPWFSRATEKRQAQP